MYSKKALRSAACFSALLFCAEIKAGTILAGTQYQQSLFGQFDLGPGLGIIPTVGRAFGPGNTSIEIRRLADATINPGQTVTIPVQMVAISIESTAPVAVGGNLYNAFLHLTPGTVSLGNEVITQTNPDSAAFQGSFFLDTQPFVTVDFTPIGAGQAFSRNLQFTATSEVASWRHKPLAGELVVTSLANPALLNCHDPAGGCFQDFFIEGTLTFAGARAGGQTNASATPEPASTHLLVGTGLLALARLRLRKRKGNL